MKLKRMILILLALCMVLPLTACMSAGTNPTETQTVPTTTVPVTTTTAPPPTTTVPGPKTLNLSDYETGIDNSYITEDTVLSLLRQVVGILKEYDQIIIPLVENLKRGYVNMNLDEFPDAVSVLPADASRVSRATELAIDTSVPMSPEEHYSIIYFVLGALLLQEYEYCTYNEGAYMADHCGQIYDGKIFFCPLIKNSNYESIRELIRDYESNGKRHDLDGKIVTIMLWKYSWDSTPHCYIRTGLSGENIYERLYKTVFPTVFPNVK